MDADSSSSITDSDDEPTPIRVKEGKRMAAKMANNVDKGQMAMQFGATKMEEDAVIYRIYALSPPGATSDAEASINSTSLATVQAFAYNLSKDYIWHNEPFRLFYKDSPTPHFYGQTNFGENTEDEWFIVYLLYEISKNFPDYIISVLDSDGQFMLIEAADYIPSWLDGDVADNRVFIFRGALHIVPLSQRLKPCPRSLSPSSVNQLLIEDPARIFAILLEEELIGQSLASDNVQRSILDRIKSYPEQIFSNRHRFNCVLPAKLVALLNETGSIFLAAAVHLACQKEKVLPESSSLKFSSTDLVTTSLVLSKNLYAKMVSSREIPNYESSNWTLPKKDALGSRANELGMKLTKGLEQLSNLVTKQMNATDNHMFGSESWGKFVEMLHILGYFEDAAEGSRTHDRLLKRAQLFHQVYSRESNGETYLASLGTSLATTMQNLDVLDVDVLRIEYPPQEEDDDEWMNITPEKLEAMLSTKWMNNLLAKTSSANGSPKVKATAGMAKDGSVLTNGEHQSGPSVIPKYATNNGELKNHARSGAQDAAAGSDPFTDSVKKMFDLHIPQDGDESSDMESYGDEILDLNMDEKDAAAAVNAFANNLKQYMKRMEQDTSAGSATKPKHGKNHVRQKSRDKASKRSKANALRESSHSPGADSIDDEDDLFTPVDIDKRMVSDMLESFFPEACGQSGSASTLLHGDRPTTKRHHTKKSGDK